MADGEIAALKEALWNQYLIMRKLYAELEEEREASATAVTESLSMILRLQREKAAEKMEACQYKRMAEERIHHSDMSLEMHEEAAQQKDMEIEFLRFHLMAYKQKLINLESSIPFFGEKMLSENKSSIELDAGSCKYCFNGIFRRNASVPSLCNNDVCSVKGFSDEKTAGYCSCVLNNEVQSTSIIGSVGSCLSASDSDVPTCSTKRDKSMTTNNDTISISPSQIKVNENLSCLERQFSENAMHYTPLSDEFEASSSHEGCKSGERCKKLLHDTLFETNSISVTPDLMPNEAEVYLFNDDECLSKAIMGNHIGRKFSMPVRGAIVSPESKMSAQKKSTSVPHFDFEQLSRRLQQLEDERVILRVDSERGMEQLKLLREIFKKLNTIETLIERSTSKKSSSIDKPSYVSVLEAALSFSI